MDAKETLLLDTSRVVATGTDNQRFIARVYFFLPWNVTGSEFKWSAILQFLIVYVIQATAVVAFQVAKPFCRCLFVHCDITICPQGNCLGVVMDGCNVPRHWWRQSILVAKLGDTFKIQLSWQRPLVSILMNPS